MSTISKHKSESKFTSCEFHTAFKKINYIRMKTSKIIFISLLSTIALLILVVMAGIRLSGRRNSGSPSDFKIKKQVLQPFKVLSINNSRNITLIRNDSSFIEVTYLKDSIAPEINFKIREDTLIISDFEKVIHRNGSIRINSTDLLGRLTLVNSDISIENFSAGKIVVEMDKSSIWFNQRLDQQTAYHTLDIVARNQSRINSTKFRVDTLGIALYNSEVNLEIMAGVIKGDLSDSSRIYVRQADVISLKKDVSSHININD